MEKWMIVYVLPLEVWMDIFCFPWISRRKFGRLVDRIGNWKFAEHAQFYLHAWGKRTMGNLVFKKNGFYKRVYDKPYELLSLAVPQTEMPENIKSFDNIIISHFDARTMDFLGRIGSLLTDVQIELGRISPKHLLNLRLALTNFAQFMRGIRSVWCSDQHPLPVVDQCLGSKFANAKVLNISGLGNAKGLSLENLNIVMDWLTQSDNGGPKLCKLHLYSDEGLFEQISQAMRQQFQAAKTPSTFAVHLSSSIRMEVQFAEFHLVNSIGEELHGMWTKLEEKEIFQITRHRANCSGELQEWIEEMNKERENGCVQFVKPTIGSINADALMNVQQPVEVEDVQQPSTSKEA